VLKNSVESFDGAQDERRNFEIIEDFPFMLRRSKHSVPFFSNLLEFRYAIQRKEITDERYE
jgi:hypothetical protein